MNCPCCRAERRVITTINDDVIETKIEHGKSTHRRPLIPGREVRVWPPTREKARMLIETLRFCWKHDRIFEFTIYMLMLCYTALARDFFSDNGYGNDFKGMFYYFWLFLYCHIIFYSWGFRRERQPGRLTNSSFYDLIIICTIWSGAKTWGKDLGLEALRSILPELVIIFCSLLTLSFGVSDSTLDKRHQLKENEDEGRMRRRIIAEQRARVEGVYVPILLQY